MEQEIRKNLAKGRFMLFYQPQFDLATRSVVGMEALLRWRHPELGMSSPERVIAVAEQSGLIVDIDAWTLRAACAQVSKWRSRGMPYLRTAINFSAINLHREGFAGKVERILKEFNLPADWLELEVTESVLNTGCNVIDELVRLKALGVTLAIDDFGTGYSSLSSLKHLPIDRIKIDRSFITDVPGNRSDAGITQAIITMGHNLNLKVIAEGVENEDQWQFLRSLGCDEAQGFLFSKPLAASLIPPYLTKKSSMMLADERTAV